MYEQCRHLADDVVEGVLQLSVDSRQFLVVSVGLVDRNDDFVDVVDGFKHLRLERNQQNEIVSKI